MCKIELTPRERQIFLLIGKELTSKEIANLLFISVSPVSNHRKHICRKLALHSTASLVAHALKLGND